MLLSILDGNGIAQTVITAGQEAVVDQSDVITATGIAQDLMVANATRSGWSLQNLSASDLYVNELGEDAVADSTSWRVPAGGYFPPPGFPVTTTKISVLGTVGAAITAREW